MEVLGPKGPIPYGGLDLADWAERQLEIAGEIMDNPGGGLLFATQTVGQVRAALREEAAERWAPVLRLLAEAEDLMVRREFSPARELLREAAAKLPR